MNLNRQKSKRKSNSSHFKSNKLLNSYYTQIFLIIFFGLVLFSKLPSFDLVYCDDSEIINNSERLSNVSNIAKEMQRGYINTNYYRPIINLSFILDYQVTQSNPAGYHWTNIIFHICNSILILLFLKQFISNNLLIFFLSLIFLIHPINNNSVAWIVGRNDLISTFFILLSLIFFILYLKTNQKRNLIVHSIFVTTAFLCKESSLIAPFIFICFYFLFKGKNIDLRNLGLVIILWIVSFLFFIILRNSASLGNPVYNSGFYLFENIRFVPEILFKLFIPIRLSVLPTYNFLNSFAGIVLIILILSFGLKLRSKGYEIDTLVFMGLIWFIIACLPGMFVQNIDHIEWNDYLETRSYFANIGIIFSISILLKNINWNKKLSIIMVSLIVLLSYLSFSNQENYRNSQAFYESAYNSDPTKAKFNFLLGKVYLKNDNFSKAEFHFKKAYNLSPANNLYCYNLGTFYYNIKNFKKAIEFYKISLKRQFNSNKIFLPIIDSYLALGLKDTANYYLTKYYNLIEGTDTNAIILLDISSQLSNYKISNISIEELFKKNKDSSQISKMINSVAENQLKYSKDNSALWLLNRALEYNSKNINSLKNLLEYHLVIKNDTLHAFKYYLFLKENNEKLSKKYLKVFNKK